MTQRRWFQIHLSTAVVMMFVAGIVIWLNVIPHGTADDLFGVRDAGGMEGRGTPVVFESWRYKTANAVRTFNPAALCIDIVYGLVVVAASAVPLEYCVRRRSE